MKLKRVPELIDLQGNLIAVLNNASSIGYKKKKNGLWTCRFTLPLKDSKASLVLPKYHIVLYDHGERIGRFVVNPKRTTKNLNTRQISFECEHVLSLLHNDILYQYHQISNFDTATVLSFLLEQQETNHWEVGTVSINRFFHYAWENEDSLLNAIMSVPKPFDVPYQWTWDDSVYPFKLNLLQPSNVVKDVIVAGKNLKGIELKEDPSSLFTRIFPIGSGEGVNKVNISKINNGIPYLKNATAEAKYGIINKIFVDTRFEEPEPLKATAQSFLDKYSEPIRSATINAIDYSLVDQYDLGRFSVGDVIGVFDLDTSTDIEMRVEVYEKSDVYGSPEQLNLELGDKINAINMTIADLQKKQLVNEVYSQGATNIDSRDFVGECDQNYPAIIRFHLPEDVVNINSMLLTFETLKYRAYSKGIEGGGAAVISSTSSSGGAVESKSQSSAAGGNRPSTSKTSAAGGDHRHAMFSAVGYGVDPNPDSNVILVAHNGLEIRAGSDTAAGLTYYTEGASGTHQHLFEIPEVPDHTHDYIIPAIEPHDHEFEVNVPSHNHPILHGIFEYPTLPTSVTIKVDGNTVPISALSAENIDLIPYLQKDADGKILRGRFVEIVITPNDLARMNVTLTSRLFIQSRIGGKY
ncbi:phage tail spike protein [Chryseomicrobium aureum]|uniref:phage tail spike protein n=1 Tax=Chryseomicrobium aureum TaxID=1441723 RepID=UPI00370DDFD4